MKGYSGMQLLQLLESQKLIKNVGGKYYLTDRLQTITHTVDSAKDALKQFCDDIELPFQVTTPTGQKYTVRYVTDRIGKLYLSVLAQVDKDELIRVTKKYYKETEYPVTIKNYFEQNVWESALESKDSNFGSGSLNPFEEV